MTCHAFLQTLSQLFLTIGPGPSSIEGLIYTKVPLRHHLIIPWEGILQTFVFSLLLIHWEKGISKRTTQILFLFSIILLVGIVMGIVQAI